MREERKLPARQRTGHQRVVDRNHMSHDDWMRFDSVGGAVGTGLARAPAACGSRWATTVTNRSDASLDWLALDQTTIEGNCHATILHGCPGTRCWGNPTRRIVGALAKGPSREHTSQPILIGVASARDGPLPRRTRSTTSAGPASLPVRRARFSVHPVWVGRIADESACATLQNGASGPTHRPDGSTIPLGVVVASTSNHKLLDFCCRCPNGLGTLFLQVFRPLASFRHGFHNAPVDS